MTTAFPKYSLSSIIVLASLFIGLAQTQAAPLEDTDIPDGATVIDTGAKQIVWGGSETGHDGLLTFPSGFIYDRAQGKVTGEISSLGAPWARWGHSAVWTGRKMIVFGGTNGSLYFSDGAIYDPTANTWVSITLDGGPTPRAWHKATIKGQCMEIRGGVAPSHYGTGEHELPDSDGRALDLLRMQWQDRCPE